VVAVQAAVREALLKWAAVEFTAVVAVVAILTALAAVAQSALFGDLAEPSRRRIQGICNA
jgi:hypothetical protein